MASRSTGSTLPSPYDLLSPRAAPHAARHSLCGTADPFGVQAMGDEGPFQRFERSEISQDEFYAEFGRRLSDVAFCNESYRKYCKRVGIGTPSSLRALSTTS